MLSTLRTNGNITTEDDSTDPIGKAIEKYFVSSILLIEKHFESSNQFLFKTVEISDIE